MSKKTLSILTLMLATQLSTSPILAADFGDNKQKELARSIIYSSLYSNDEDFDEFVRNNFAATQEVSILFDQRPRDIDSFKDFYELARRLQDCSNRFLKEVSEKLVEKWLPTEKLFVLKFLITDGPDVLIQTILEKQQQEVKEDESVSPEKMVARYVQSEAVQKEALKLTNIKYFSSVNIDLQEMFNMYLNVLKNLNDLWYPYLEWVFKEPAMHSFPEDQSLFENVLKLEKVVSKNIEKN